MRGADKVNGCSLFHSLGESNTRGQRFTVRGNDLGGPKVQPFDTEGGAYMKRAARGSSGGGYHYGI